MHSFSRSLLGLGALTLAGCGAPAELDESRFPGLNDTGYMDSFSPIGGAGSGRGGAPPSNAGAPGTSGTGNVPAGGSGSVGQGGSASPSTGGSGSVSAGGGPAVGQSGSGSEGGSDQPGSSNCPDDITVLFKRPASQGGCDGAGCHIPDGQKPDLVSPGVETRLVDVVSGCNGLPYISAGESYLENKLVGPPACNFAMPLGGAMNDADKQCVIEWIDEVSGG